ncbi:uncharacterized protein LOC120851115 [Ixodes scapularis]|uniref:uncharacterized protein LOC120851115 n=1 Tax=Ixodes scapularis TaxID=6945 RepID=UPI001A9CBE13|nr:uncharacterized protein LOC120851115 [Ixodes scapularis]
MMRQLLVVILLGSSLTILVDGNVDTILETVRNLIRQMVPNPEMQQQFLAKVDEAKECLDMAKGINPDVVKKLVDGIIPTAASCAAQTVGVSDMDKRKELMKACFKEKAEDFKKSSGMTDDELAKFEMAGKCLEEKVQA